MEDYGSRHDHNQESTTRSMLVFIWSIWQHLNLTLKKLSKWKLLIKQKLKKRERLKIFSNFLAAFSLCHPEHLFVASRASP
jgi:hypothetical protein